MNGIAITGRSYYDLEKALLEALVEVREKDRFTPVTVLVGSNLLGMYLRRKLADASDGLFNVRFLTFVDLSRMIENTSYTRLRPTPPPFTERLILQEILSSGDVPACFSGAVTTRGFTDTLLSAFTDLTEGGCTPEVAKRVVRRKAPAQRLEERVIGVLSLYARFRERVEALGGDIHTSFGNAIEMVKGISLPGPILAYGFYDFNEEQWRLIEALADGPGVMFFIPWQDEEPYTFARRTLERLQRVGFECISPTGGDRVGGKSPRTVLMSAPSAEEEARGVVRRILRLVDERGLNFGDVGILVSNFNEYGQLFREVLEEASIPYFSHRENLGASSPAVRGVLQLLQLLCGRVERRKLVEFLVSAPLLVPNQRDGRFDPFSCWVRKSAEAGMVGDKGWIIENRRLIERLERAEHRGEETEEAVVSARVVGEILETIIEAGASFEGTRRWSDFAHSLHALIKKLFVASETELVCHIVDRLRGLDNIAQPVSFDTFRRFVEAASLESAGFSGHFLSQGVNLLLLSQARGISFKVVFVPGLTESSLPGTVRQNPFLKDEERLVLGSVTSGAVVLSEKLERIDEEALIFRLVLDAAEDELVCSYPRFEEGTGKERIPSSFLRFVNGYAIDGNHAESITSIRLSRYEKGIGGEPPLSTSEYDLAMTGGYRRGAGFPPANRFFSRGASLVWSRWGKRKFTPYDGVFASHDALRELHQMLDEKGWRFSPTSMESYAACPFSYYLSYILHVDSLEEPERIISITPLQRGSIVHAIVARLYRELRGKGLLPVDEASRDQIFQITPRMVNGFLSEYPESEPVGLQVFWEIEKRMISASVTMLLEEELAEGEGYVPVCFEEPFGGLKDRVEVPFPCGERVLMFRGRIDRIDVGPEDNFRVLDYKTGRLTGKDQDTVGGTSLQLPIYLFAASKILGIPVTGGRAEFRRVGVGEGKRRITFYGARWDELKAELERDISVITRGIEDGLFFAAVPGERCRFCSLRHACPSGRARLFEVKSSGDDRCHNYLIMRGLAGEER